MKRRLQLLVTIPVLFFCVAATWNEREYATGNWNGLRSQLEKKYGLHLDLDYTAETFVSDESRGPSYRGNIDLVLTINTQKFGLWNNGTFFVYGEHAHGGGISDQLGLIMPASNLEAEPFTQLSEFWLYQQIGGRLKLRLGKQDANRDFGNPRFSGNFINSSFGVLPGTPMPSFPAPGLGAAAFLQTNRWLELRAGIYEGTPKIGSFVRSAFADHAGAFGIASIVLHHGIGQHQFGAWTQTSTNRNGIFGVFDFLLPLDRSTAARHRSVQFFTRGDWSPNLPKQPDVVTAYFGGGVTAHAFLGRNNTIGVGGGLAHTAANQQSFLETFIKLRDIAWLTFEPDAQLFFTPKGNHVGFGLRTKLKL